MYITTAYLYQQIQTVLMIDTSGNYFNARWSPVYAKKLKLNRGVDNTILFQFQNQDQRNINISGYTFVFRIISQDGSSLLYTAELTHINDLSGRAKIVIPAEDTRALIAQTASWSIESVTSTLNQAVFTDDYAGARGTIDIVDSVFPNHIPSKQIRLHPVPREQFKYQSDIISTNGQGILTFQFDLINFSGSLKMLGADNISAIETAEWYSVDVQEIAPTNTLFHELQDYTGSLALNVIGYHPIIKVNATVTSGYINRIIYR